MIDSAEAIHVHFTAARVLIIVHHMHHHSFTARGAFGAALCAFFCGTLASLTLLPLPAYASTAATVSTPFLYTFNTAGTLPEASPMSTSWSPYWWVNSGAYLIMQDGLGKTVQGALGSLDPWRLLYATTNPLDTDNGYYPQNIFRLVTRSQWTNDTEQMQFKIQHTNLTDTPNRGGYSGVLFFSRYQNGDNLYYAGIRQDGTAVIKKKIGGVYYTMDQEVVWPGTYDKWNNPTLIPQKQWMRLRLVTQNEPDGSVALTLYLDATNAGNYVEVAHATDTNGKYGGTPVIGNAGYAGIRTDYEDVFLNDYELTAI
jgi:hypothetical protein